MGKLLGGFMLAIVAFLTVGCDKQGKPLQEFGLDKLEKGISSESDVRMVMGQPETVWEEDDGGRALQYPKGPEGVRTWEFIIDKQGKLKDYRQLLTEETFARIKTGMTKDTVRRMLGKPRTVQQYKLKNEEAWDWRYLTGTTERFFNVHFDMTTGRVTGTSSSDASNY
ncbi:outer membrane protein assembly factor BamE [Herbaspirillum sp. GCM10030257]|uniref:outer membrane protein assembly factor BamE domain-containing protein n=1 Tax=Herbaspirillum sp. GCM10030257 TaxID=3273393 RepID=UPI0036207D88